MRLNNIIRRILGITPEYIIVEMNYLTKEIHKNAKKKGFWKNYQQLQQMKPLLKKEMYLSFYYSFVSQQLALIGSEVSEAVEYLRHNDSDTLSPFFKEELADIIIRTIDLAEGLDIDIIKEITEKHQKNLKRPKMHNKNF